MKLDCKQDREKKIKGEEEHPFSDNSSYGELKVDAFHPSQEATSNLKDHVTVTTGAGV